MTHYIPLFIIGCVLMAVCVACSWPWLRNPHSRDKAIMLSMTAVFLSMSLYLWLGSPFALDRIHAQQSFNRDVTTRITTLSQSLQQASQPNSPERAGEWVELGSAYMQAELYVKAADAFRHAVLASEGEPHVILAYGKAQMLAADGKVTEDAKKAFEMAGDLLPDNPEPLFLLAVGKMQEGDREGGRKLFEKLLPLLPEGAPLRKRILHQMEASKTAE
jgi:cytochrome c-type biogenesis protein CcmH